MHCEHGRARRLTRRAALLAGGELVLFGSLAGRLYYLQVVEAKRYARLADENRISIRLLTPPRGRIIDRFGVALATNQPSYRSVIVAEQSGDIGATLDALGKLIPLNDTDRKRVLRATRREPAFVPILIRKNLTWDEMARVEVSAPGLPGVSIDRMRKRFYPFSETAFHTVGYVAAVSEKELGGADDRLLDLPDYHVGKSGIEKAHDRELRGRPGTSQVEVNAYGRVVRELARQTAIAGRDVVLSLDLPLQELATQRCAAQGSAGGGPPRCADRRGARPRLDPGLRPECVCLGLDSGDVAGAGDGPVASARQQGDWRELCAWLDIQADRSAGCARRRRDNPRHALLLSRIFRAWRHGVSLLEAERPRQLGRARRDQAVL